jgi:hypothetical protein
MMDADRMSSSMQYRLRLLFIPAFGLGENWGEKRVPLTAAGNKTLA